MTAKSKVYFACSIRGGGHTSSYQAITGVIKDGGVICLGEVLINNNLQPGDSRLLPQPPLIASIRYR